MDGVFLEKKAIAYNDKLNALKKEINDSFPWYPYGSLNNFIHLKRIFNDYPLTYLMEGESKTLDIGAADGDLSFFLETLGFKPDIIDYGPTNYNNLEGVKLLKKKLDSLISISEIDIDAYFPAINTKYGLIFFLGILYHLKNPFYILERLSAITNYLVISTRVAKFTPNNTLIVDLPVAYLLAPDESNNDSTNYWIFSKSGLKRIFDRSGWEIKHFFTVGDTEDSNPADNAHDERAFALLKSKRVG